MMNKNDFEFIKYDPEYEDYWFKVSGKTAEWLTDEYMEMCMVGVTEVVYSKVEDIIGIKRLFPFNYDVVMSDNEELKNILIEISETIEVEVV